MSCGRINQTMAKTKPHSARTNHSLGRSPELHNRWAVRWRRRLRLQSDSSWQGSVLEEKPGRRLGRLLQRASEQMEARRAFAATGGRRGARETRPSQASGLRGPPLGELHTQPRLKLTLHGRRHTPTPTRRLSRRKDGSEVKKDTSNYRIAAIGRKEIGSMQASLPLPSWREAGEIWVPATLDRDKILGDGERA